MGQEGLFAEPEKPCPHTNTRQNEHQLICVGCEVVVGDAPH